MQRASHAWGTRPSNRWPLKLGSPESWAISCRGPGAGQHKLCVTQGFGIADPFADDSSTGRGIVLGRAATKLRSIEIQPLTGGSTSHRLVDPPADSRPGSSVFEADGYDRLAESEGERRVLCGGRKMLGGPRGISPASPVSSTLQKT